MSRITGGPPKTRLYARCLWTVFTWVVRDRVVDVNTAKLTPIQIPYTVTVDAVIHAVTTVTAGNIRSAIYADNGDTPVGGALIVESAAEAAGLANQKQEVSIADTQLTPGLYWLAINANDGALRLNHNDGTLSLGGTLQGCGYALAFGPFTDPCPAVTIGSTSVFLGVRVKSIP